MKHEKWVKAQEYGEQCLKSLEAARALKQKEAQDMTQKQADIRYRVEIKSNGIVVYTVRSSDDTRDYQVTVFEGKVSGCNCPAYKPCYHMRDVQIREDARKPVSTDQKGTLHSASGQAFSLLK